MYFPSAYIYIYFHVHTKAWRLLFSGVYMQSGVLRCIMQNAAPRVINYELPSSNLPFRTKHDVLKLSTTHTTERALHCTCTRMGAKRRCTIYMIIYAPRTYVCIPQGAGEYCVSVIIIINSKHCHTLSQAESLSGHSPVFCFACNLMQQCTSRIILLSRGPKSTRCRNI